MATIMELVMELNGLKREYNANMFDLPKSYVNGSEAFKTAQFKLTDKYNTESEVIRNQINMKLAKMEATAKTIQTIHATQSAPTTEELEAGYKVVDMIAKTSKSISEDTLNRLVSKVKDMDQLAVIHDVISGTGEIGLKNIVKKRIVDLDEVNTKQNDKLKLVQDFDAAFKASNDEMTYNVLALAAALDSGDE